MEFRRVLIALLASSLLALPLYATTDGLTIVQEPGKNPWTSLNLNNDPDSFQFAIIADRNGGNRPGVFEDAIRKLNMMQPEFVVNVGDLIKGYSKDKKAVNRMWDELEPLVRKLKMPFFYVPGNHDLTNPMQVDIWRERLGRTYYHFRYRDVLFLCMSSEDPHRQISEQQIAYFRKALEDNQDARWTFIFMHQPIWVERTAKAKRAARGGKDVTTTPTNWSKFEPLLQGRQYTVFAGHTHNYYKHVRNNRNYYVLATTGGGSKLRGTAFGEFDHIVWVTMTSKGPVIANLLLSGILPEDVRPRPKQSASESTTASITRASVKSPVPGNTAKVGSQRP